MRKAAMAAAAAGWILFSGAVASAQDTGSVSGSVVDRAGAPVAGATIRIAGDAMPSDTVEVTTESGAFTFLLLPGEYIAEVEKSGVGRTSRAIVVEPGRETRLDVVLGTVVAESVAVSAAAAPEVDLKSAEVGFSFRRTMLQDLPLDRSYRGLIQVVPGVAENNGFAPNGGGSRQDNVYLLDSANITNPFFGYLSTEINELDIAQFEIKRGALRPEFGRTIGMVSNAVLKSGTNALAGAYRFEAVPSAWVAASSKTVRSRTNRFDHAGDAGGPLIRNQLFFYGSARHFRSSSPDAENLFGPIPDRRERTHEWFGKISGRLAGDQLINVAYRHRPTTIDLDGIGAYDSPDAATNVEGTNRVANVSYDWFLDSRTIASVKYAHLEEDTARTAVTDLGFQPAFNQFGLDRMGHLVVGALTIGGAALRLNRQDYARDELRAMISHAFTSGRLSHQIKAGFGWDDGRETLLRRSNGWGDISNVIINGRQRIRTTYYPDQPAQRSTGRTYALFAQDDFTFGARVTINAGLLLNRDEFVQAASGQTDRFPPFGFGDEIQPRVGVVYQVTKGQGDKVYANWGRYFGLDQKSSARAVSSGRLYTEDTDFDPITGAFIERAVSANTGAKPAASDLQPPVTDELVAGYAAPLADGWTLDAFVLARRTRHFIEDLPTVLPFASFEFRNDPAAHRNFRTVTVSLRRRLQDRWSMDVSYAWSRLSGNYDQDDTGDFLTASFSTASLIDDGPGAFTTDRYRDGVLSQDRTHVYKILGTWQPPRVDHLTVGVYVRGQSGTPWAARGLPWNSAVTYLRFLEPAGSSRTPFWTNADLLLKYSRPLGPKRAVHFEGRVLNVFDQETPLLVDQRRYLDPRNLTIAGTPPAGCASCFTDAFVQGTSQPNTKFGQPIAFARPRRLLASVMFEF